MMFLLMMAAAVAPEQDVPPAPPATEIGTTPAPAPPEDHAADALFDPAEMARAREMLRKENGGLISRSVMFNLAEYQARARSDGYRWEGTARIGGDLQKLVIKSEGEGSFGGELDDAETQLLYSRAIAPYFDLQVGVRYDIKPNPSRTYAVVGIEGIAPFWFDVDAQLFLSNKGDVLARLEGYYDQRITQRLIAQPRAELNLAAQDVRENGIGSGFSDLELGLRVRYEIKPEFAPYIGVEWVRQFGDTARFARAAGGEASVTNFVAGLHFWF
jgi:copper resistance protein B